MNDESSLKRKKVLVPRGKKSAKSFSDLIKKLGGKPIEIPLLDFKPTENTEEILSYIEQIHSYDWIIFTSAVTIDTFFSFFKENQLPTPPKVAAIGKKTKEALEKRGVTVHFMPEKYVAESFVEEFAPLVKEGDKILLPKGKLAREYIAQSLQEKGVIVDEVIIYDTFFPEDSRELLRQSLVKKEIDILTFTSPSTVDHFMEVVNEHSLQDNIRDCLIACIGPEARKRAMSYGLNVHIMPKNYTVYDMITSVMEFLNKNEKRVQH